MVYRVTIKNADNWTDFVYVEAKDFEQAGAKVQTEYPNHRITGISEDVAIAIIS